MTNSLTGMDKCNRNTVDKNVWSKTSVVIIVLVCSSMIDFTTSQKWACPAAASTDAAIAKQLNISKTTKNVTVLVDICLNKVKEIENDITGAVVACEWDGSETEFSRLRMSKITLTGSCQKVCSKMQEIRTCANSIQYTEYNAKRYDEFCMSYFQSIECKNRTLASGECSIAESLFEQGMDDAIKRAFRYICNPGCPNITDAYSVIQKCFRDFNIDSDRSCSNLHSFQSCITLDTPCDEIWGMVPYFSTSFTDLTQKCPKLITPQTTEQVMSTISQRIRSEATGCLSSVKQTGTHNVTDKNICWAVNCLLDIPVDLQQLPVIEKDDSILQTITDRWTSCRNTFTGNRTEEKKQNVTTLSTMTQTNEFQQAIISTMDTNTLVSTYATEKDFRQTTTIHLQPTSVMSDEEYLVYTDDPGEADIAKRSTTPVTHNAETSIAATQTSKPADKLPETTSNTLSPQSVETSTDVFKEIHSTLRSTSKQNTTVVKPVYGTTKSLYKPLETTLHSKSDLFTPTKVISPTTLKPTPRPQHIFTASETERSKPTTKQPKAGAQQPNGGTRVTVDVLAVFIVLSSVWSLTCS